MAATNGIEGDGRRRSSMAVRPTLAESASLSDYFRVRRHLIDGITISLGMCGQLADDPLMRDAYFKVALDDAEALDALEEKLAERIRT